MMRTELDHVAIDLSIALDISVSSFLDGKGVTEEAERGAILERALGYFILRYALEAQQPGEDLHQNLHDITSDIASLAARLAAARPIVDAIQLCGGGAR